jgi:hypothetical protein
MLFAPKRWGAEVHPTRRLSALLDMWLGDTVFVWCQARPPYMI